MSDSFKFYRLMFDTGMKLQDPMMRLQYFEAIITYGLDGTLPEDPVMSALINGAVFSIDKSNVISEMRSKNMIGNQNARKTWEIDGKQKKQKQTQTNRSKQKKQNPSITTINSSNISNSSIYSNISSYEDIYSLYYKGGKGVDPVKCDPLLDGLLARGVTVDDIKKGVVLYNSICRLRGSDGFRYTKNFDTWLREYHKPTEDQLEETLATVIGMHKEKCKSDPKYKDSKRSKALVNELCDVFGKEKVNAIFMREGSGLSIKFT